jgi:hypothetical protein
LFAYFVAVLVTWMSFASIIRELRRSTLTMLGTHIVMSSLIFRLTLTSSRAFSHFSHEPNHCSYGFGSRENNFVHRCFCYDPRPYRGDHFPRRSGFPTGGSHTHFELRHLDGPHFPCRGSCPTSPNGEVQRTMKTTFGHMVKYWIPKIYLTNSSTESLISSRPM